MPRIKRNVNLTVDVKEALIRAFYKGGSEKYLLNLMFQHPSVFASLLGKLIPVEVSAQINHNLIDLGAAMIEAQKRTEQKQMIDITPDLVEIATVDDLSG